MLRPARDKKMAGKSKEQKNTSRRDKLWGGGGGGEGQDEHEREQLILPNDLLQRGEGIGESRDRFFGVRGVV